MSQNLLIAIIINIGILLVVSWIFGAYFISTLIKEKNALANNSLDTPKGNEPQDTPETTEPPKDYSILLSNMAKEIEEKEHRINTLQAIQNQHEQTKQQLQSPESHNNLAAYLEQLEKNKEKTEHIILSLQADLDSSRETMARMQKNAISEQDQQVRIAALERSEIRLRDENKKLRITGMQIAETLEARNHKIEHLQQDNKKLKKSIASLASASKEQLGVIKKLHDQIERAEQLEAHQQQLIEDLENKLRTEKSSTNDEDKINIMEAELSDLRDTLKRTLIEKDFIEEHMLELDDSLEKARETEEALSRAQAEIASLEKQFPQYQPPENDESENSQEISDASSVIAVDRPIFTTDIPELNYIIDNNGVFGSVQAFWMTLDLPPLNMADPQPIPKMENWAYIGIGDKDYAVLMVIDDALAQTVSQAMFKDQKETQSDTKDAIGELGNIIAGTLATELKNDFPVGVPEHISHQQAENILSTATVASEVFLSAKQKLFYVALIIPEQHKTSE